MSAVGARRRRDMEAQHYEEVLGDIESDETVRRGRPSGFEARELSKVNSAFMAWASTWDKSYQTDEEYRERKKTWMEVNDMIVNNNRKSEGQDRSQHPVFLDHNKFSDRTHDELKK